mgnify:FL=1|jgi:uncharacterized protein (TIRG00374 family)|tara:strand:- start:169 stop:1119 length:951 start_codon:yes stop_codon:yes gene_type:complete
MISISLKKILIVCISVIGLYSIFLSFSDLNLISDALLNFKTEFLPLILILVTSSWFILFIRWQILLKNANITIPLRGSFVVYVSGFALQFIPGEVGEFLKVQLLKNKFNIPRSKTSPIIITEMLYNAMGLVALSITSIWFFEFTIYIFIIFGVLLVVLFYLINNKKYFFKVMNKVSKIKFLKKYVEPTFESLETIQHLTKGKVLFYSLILSILFWFVECIAIHLLLLSFGIDTIELLTLVSMYSSSIILGVVSFLPFGLGVFEGSLAGFLSLRGIDITFSLTIVILARIITRWYSVFVGLVVLKITHGLSSSSNEK